MVPGEGNGYTIQTDGTALIRAAGCIFVVHQNLCPNRFFEAIRTAVVDAMAFAPQPVHDKWYTINLLGQIQHQGKTYTRVKYHVVGGQQFIDSGKYHREVVTWTPSGPHEFVLDHVLLCN